MAREKIYCADLAKELGLHHQAISRHPLGCIGDTLLELSEQWPEKIPPIQGIVVNQQTGLQGDNVNFLRLQKMDPLQKEVYVNNVLADVFSYPRWLNVLEALGLSPAEPIDLEIVQPADHWDTTTESDAHKRLKDYVAHHPKVVGLGKSLAPGKKEFRLPSGDRIDVLFQNTKCRIAVEVKSYISDKFDLKRGLFQCIKYRAVLRAYQGLKYGTYEVDALLAIEGSLSKELIRLRNRLGVKVIENIQVK